MVEFHVLRLLTHVSVQHPNDLFQPKVFLGYSFENQECISLLAQYHELKESKVDPSKCICVGVAYTEYYLETVLLSFELALAMACGETWSPAENRERAVLLIRGSLLIMGKC